MTFGIGAWIGFNLFVLFMLALDLGVFNRKVHVVAFKEALMWTIAWIALALAFNVGLYFYSGAQIAQEFLAGYLLEKSLSVDNIFVFLLIFSYFNVPRKYQHRVLFWGILGALIFRGALIGMGTALMHSFHWVIYVFGAFLVITGAKMAFHKPDEVDIGKNKVLRYASKILPVSQRTDTGAHFLSHENGRWLVTPLFLVLLVVETTDIVFALDSIPAVFGVTDSAFIVYSSNVFAILGLRALYFVLAGVLDLFRYLNFGLSAVLVFIGLKMMFEKFYEIPIGWALAVVGTLLTISIVASVLASHYEKRRARKKGIPPDPEAQKKPQPVSCE